MNMSTSEHRLIGFYESIGRLSRTMVTAAERADWESLAAAERICGLVIERIEAFGDPEAQLGPREQNRRLAILRSVLEDDARIRRYTEPSLARFDGWLARPLSRGRGG